MRWRLLLRRTGRALAALLLLASAAIAWLLLGSLPSWRGEWRVAGLDGPLEIARDAMAIPTIRAGSERDAYAGLGFVHAQDRLWQMELARRVGQGRLAEILGAEALPIDRMMRTLGLYRLAEASFAHLSADAQGLLLAYAAGVNAYLDRWQTPLPPEFQLLWHTPEPWRPADSLVFARLMALELSGNWRDELLRARLAAHLRPDQLADLWPVDPPDVPVTMAAAAVPQDLARLDRTLDLGALAALPEIRLAGGGSNVIALAGSRTASGAALLASDPHLGLQAPGVWYLARLVAPGLDVQGGTMPAMPFVVIGRNRDIAWGMTTTGGDTQDLFIERPDPRDPGRYLTPVGSVPFERRSERIVVRGGEAEEIELRWTRHGPVISDLLPDVAAAAGGDVLALAWTGLAAVDHTVEAGFALARAGSWPSFVAALGSMAGPEQNVAFAGAGGRIGMMTPGLLPRRTSGDGTLPVPGWTGAFDWQGTVPVDELPRTVDPASGQLVNANNRLVGPDYPHLITRHWQSAERARRIEALLDGRSGLGADDLARIQLDQRSMLAVDFLPYLLAVTPATLVEREMLAALGQWDGVMAPDRPEPLLLTAWYQALLPRIAGDELGPLLPAYRGLRSDFLRLVLRERQVWCDDVATPAVESCADQVAAAWHQAVAALLTARGADWRAWRWGEAHPAVMAHRPFSLVGGLRRLFEIRLPVGGDGTTVNVAGFRSNDPAGDFPATHAAGLRLIADLARPLAARFVAATGQSGHPLSGHYRDLARLWQQGAYVEIAAEADPRTPPSARLTLLPATGQRP